MTQENNASPGKDSQKSTLQWQRKPKSLLTKEMTKMNKAKQYDSLYVDPEGKTTSIEK